jgi:hypothetical protein
MNKTLKIVILLLCVPLTILGLKAMFVPLSMLVKFGVTSEGITGLNTVRGHLGGTLIAFPIMMIMGLRTKNSAWFLAVAVSMLVVAFGRLVGFAIDGFDQASVPPFIVELVISVVMVLAHKRLSTTK